VKVSGTAPRRQTDARNPRHAAVTSYPPRLHDEGLCRRNEKLKKSQRFAFDRQSPARRQGCRTAIIFSPRHESPGASWDRALRHLSRWPSAASAALVLPSLSWTGLNFCRLLVFRKFGGHGVPFAWERTGLGWRPGVTNPRFPRNAQCFAAKKMRPYRSTGPRSHTIVKPAVTEGRLTNIAGKQDVLIDRFTSILHFGGVEIQAHDNCVVDHFFGFLSLKTELLENAQNGTYRKRRRSQDRPPS
jgi:hypothetical protein